MIPAKYSRLWEQIDSFELDDPSASFSFSDRLARENDWSLEFALRAIVEYKKFVFLVNITQTPLTPSDEIDQVWHLHLLYTESYWLEMCEGILGRQMHHGPTKGAVQQMYFGNLYEKTLEFYTEIFGSDPPLDLWPSSSKRFESIHFSRVNRQKHWVIRKPFKLHR